MSNYVTPTVQGLSTRPPVTGDNMLGMSIKCITCGTIRVFKMNTLLHGLIARKTAAAGVEINCMQCGRRIGVTLVWMSNEAHYTFQDTEAIDALVEDNITLMPVHKS